jgi:hypothetical protein
MPLQRPALRNGIFHEGNSDEPVAFPPPHRGDVALARSEHGFNVTRIECHGDRP